MVKITDIIDTVEELAPLSLQEQWDNSGWQLRPGPLDAPCSGVMLCLDITPSTVDEAIREGCNLIVSHHPLLFRGLKSISPDRPGERALLEAIKNGIYIYSSHTALDSASEGVSHCLGEMLGLTDMRVLVPQAGADSVGLGVIGHFDVPMDTETFLNRVKKVYDAPTLRVSIGNGGKTSVSFVALCSGSGGEFITKALAAGADAYITSDTRYHDFVDFGRDLLMVDTGHYESEICTKSIFSTLISKKFPNFAVRKSFAEQNPVRYV